MPYFQCDSIFDIFGPDVKDLWYCACFTKMKYGAEYGLRLLCVYCTNPWNLAFPLKLNRSIIFCYVGGKTRKVAKHRSWSTVNIQHTQIEVNSGIIFALRKRTKGDNWVTDTALILEIDFQYSSKEDFKKSFIIFVKMPLTFHLVKKNLNYF